MLEGFESTEFTHDRSTRVVYRAGSGPAVVIMAEVPGITPAVKRFARSVASAGFTAAVPELFGRTGNSPSPRAIAMTLGRLCIAREFALFSTRRSSPVTSWLRALARELHHELGGPGVGAVGMCVTGNFALSMLLEPALIAPVLCQPSLPIGLSAKSKRALHLSQAELRAVSERVRDENVSVLGLRFTGDSLCPPERFERLRAELGTGFEAIEIDSSADNPHHIRRRAHSVITEDLLDRDGHPTKAARDRVVEFLGQKLLSTSG